MEHEHEREGGFEGGEECHVPVNIAALIRILSDSLYVRHDTCIREYVANAHDACLRANRSNPRIDVSSRGGVLSVADNGVGMTRAILHENFVTIARDRVSSLGHREGTIGVFGIGVLSGFKAAHTIEVYTRHASDDHGWRLLWKRGEDRYHVAPWVEGREPGTRVDLHLDRESAHLFRSPRDLTKSVKREFPLLPLPVTVRGGSPVNKCHSELLDAASNTGGRILDSSWACELVETVSECPDPLASVYGWFATKDERDSALRGARVFIGFPGVGREATRKNQRVTFFSRGVRVPGGAEEFLPKNLDFLVVLVDYPGLQVRLSRNEFFQDAGFESIRELVRQCAVDALKALQTRKIILQQIFAAHSSQLLNLALEDDEVLEIVKDAFQFRTGTGRSILWRDVVKRLVVDQEGERLLPYEVGLDGAVGGGQGLLVELEEKEVIERLATRDGIQAVPELVATTEEIPAPFERLRERLFASLRARGVSDIHYFMDARVEAMPAKFRTRIQDGPNELVGLAIEAMELNAKHSLIEQLASYAERLDPNRAHLVADALFAVASLKSPLDNASIEGTEIIIARMPHWLMREIDGAIPAASMRQSEARCFVAMPFSNEFDGVMAGLRGVLGASPYRWQVVRADEQHVKNMLYDNIISQMAESSRFVADISGFNENVLIEAGVMLGRSTSETLILCDRQTFERVPANFQGMLLATYDEELRLSPAQFGAWFERELERFPAFTAHVGRRPLPGRRDKKP